VSSGSYDLSCNGVIQLSCDGVIQLNMLPLTSSDAQLVDSQFTSYEAPSQSDQVQLELFELCKVVETDGDRSTLIV
jgi:hypothetical protein